MKKTILLSIGLIFTLIAVMAYGGQVGIGHKDYLPIHEHTSNPTGGVLTGNYMNLSSAQTVTGSKTFNANLPFIADASRKIYVATNDGRMYYEGGSNVAGGSYLMTEGIDYGGASSGGQVILASVNNKDININPNGTGQAKVNSSVLYHAGNMYTFKSFVNVSQNVLSASLVEIAFATETGGWDIGSYFNTGTYRYTPPAGYYSCIALIQWQDMDSGNVTVWAYKNGTGGTYIADITNFSTAAQRNSAIPFTVYLNGTDYVSVFTDSVTDTNYYVMSSSFFTCYRIN